MYGTACWSTCQVSAAGIANTSAPAVSATAVVTCVSLAPATSAFHSAWSAAEVSTKMSAAVLTGGEAIARRGETGERQRRRVRGAGIESRSRTIAYARETITLAHVRATHKGVASETSPMPTKVQPPPRAASQNEHPI
jgi:hypothetical protein